VWNCSNHSRAKLQRLHCFSTINFNANVSATTFFVLKEALIKTIVNLVQMVPFIFFSYIIFEQGLPNDISGVFLMFSIIVAALVALFYINFVSVDDKETYFGLILERRKLEEKAKINKLKDGD
jgi:hypothetical protein